MLAIVNASDVSSDKLTGNASTVIYYRLGTTTKNLPPGCDIFVSVGVGLRRRGE
jgi:hypothetical protein